MSYTFSVIRLSMFPGLYCIIFQFFYFPRLQDHFVYFFSSSIIHVSGIMSYTFSVIQPSISPGHVEYFFSYSIYPRSRAYVVYFLHLICNLHFRDHVVSNISRSYRILFLFDIHFSGLIFCSLSIPL